ncbi:MULTISPECIES: hypothetical protein [Streptomyces]|uniref:Integral membrane protein n=1 Tax=Streptomyces sviceus (strain ATCC 29083 / DSM 924 / JCM 4929 / NBRC 13980 / NCIMB 11184 / NRRL 5439 / UC 5370) TaxID=463191 RepID=B5HUG2_STRX2|nr:MULTISPECIES: hypothetical protein [Streptomyces]EDY56467.1 integral membrane protein [Streptomyces sviceus ATCC 29083]MYT06952.1 hypothetical protein [Streptomyces sp. SID5470]
MTAPHARSGGDLRVLRAAVFAAVCVVLAAAGHAIASCATVPLWTLGAGFVGVVLVVAPLAGRARSLPGIATLLAVGQTVLHVLFGLGQHGTTAMSASMSSMSSMSAMSSTQSVSDTALVQQAARLLCGTTAAAISPAQAQKLLTDARLYPGTGTTAVTHSPDAMSGTSVWPSLPMILGHVLAAVAAGWLLRHGDLALLRLAELSTCSAHSVAEGALVRSLRGALALVRALRAGLPGAPEAGPRAPLTASLAPPRPRTAALQHTVIRRGPPAVAELVLTA